MNEVRDVALPSWPERIVAEHLHERRGHGTKRWRIGEALRTGGFSLVFGSEPCNCLVDATAVISALLDSGYVVTGSPDAGERGQP